MVSTPSRTGAALWPPDDTEESILGVDRHQLDILTLRQGINELAAQQAAGGPFPWQATSQVLLLGCRRPDRSAYPVYPDVAVFAHPLDRERGSYRLEQDGAPVLVVEVASPSTVQADLDLQAGKGWTYARAGVVEYLVLDPTGEMILELGRGWRLAGGRYEPWPPDEAGHWRSAMIGAVFGVDTGLAAVYDRLGRRQVREGEVATTLAAREREGREQGELSGLARGRAEGVIEGKREAVRQVARARFGEVPALEARIDGASEADLDALLGRVVIASSAEGL